MVNTNGHVLYSTHDEWWPIIKEKPQMQPCNQTGNWWRTNKYYFGTVFTENRKYSIFHAVNVWSNTFIKKNAQRCSTFRRLQTNSRFIMKRIVCFGRLWLKCDPIGQRTRQWINCREYIVRNWTITQICALIAMIDFHFFQGRAYQNRILFRSASLNQQLYSRSAILFANIR